MTTLDIKLFGLLVVERGDRPVVAFQGRRGKDLLSYLLLHRETAHTREQLATLFWGHLDGHKARHCLNTALWRLHQDLAAAGIPAHALLCADAETVGFNPASAARLDVAEFEARCAWADHLPPHQDERRAMLYRQAAALYRADLLVDCYEDWCLLERERLNYLYLRVLGWLLTYHAGRGEHDAAIGYGQRILAVDSLREEVHRTVMRSYLAARQPTAALRQYRLCERIVREELDTELMPETRALLPLMIGDGMPSRAAPTASRGVAHAVPAPLAADLVAVLAALTEAAALVERVGAHVRDATTILERAIARDVHDDLGATIDILADWPPERPPLDRVLLLLADASLALAPSHAPERERGAPGISA